MGIATPFDPNKNGWSFSNWGEENNSIHPDNQLPWELFREAYLGVHPNNDPLVAPLDSAFYEIFKICADKGNCGGMSLLALALYKYGGYMGFCSPANSYSGIKHPVSDELYKAINILQARQFSAPGIEYHIDLDNAGNLNNAFTAYDTIKTQQGKGDYAVLSIASSLFGGAAHTVIPYKTELICSKRHISIWDPNFPAGSNEGYYESEESKLVIDNCNKWKYIGKPHDNYPYEGKPGKAWCYAVPMSRFLTKARHPMSLDMGIDQIRTLVVSGPGCAVSQISDQTGAHYYRSEADFHYDRGEIEDDPEKRLYGVVRWPWFADHKNGSTDRELYFIRCAPRQGQLKLTIRGSGYKIQSCQAGNLIEIETHSDDKATDNIIFNRIGSSAQMIDFHTDGRDRTLLVRQLRTLHHQEAWRKIELEDLQLTQDGLTVEALGDLISIQVASPEKQNEFAVNLEQRMSGKHVLRQVGRFTKKADQCLHIEPRDWTRLAKTNIDHISMNFKREVDHNESLSI